MTPALLPPDETESLLLLIEHSPDFIGTADMEGRVTFLNKGGRRMIGFGEDEDISGLHFTDYVPEEWRAFFRDTVNATVREKGVWEGEMQLRHLQTGALIEVFRTSFCIRDAAGEPKFFATVTHDITERKKLERQFLRAQRMESIGTLAGGIAHDLNNVLSPILLSLDLLKMKFTDPDSQELLAIIATSAHAGADMVRQVLSFARGVEGRRLEVQVRHLIQDIERLANETFLKNIEVRTSFPHDLWTAMGDPTQLHQVLLNLCVNARDAMPHGGMLTISAENIMLDAQYAGLNLEARPGPYVLLQVEDSGTGMPPEIMEKIFDPFFTTKEVGKGTGLGLSTSLAIVKSHGGFIRVYSEPGKGATFKVYLPAQTETSPAAAAERAAGMPRGHGELILVVDDESAVREVTQLTLEAFGYRVLTAADGVEAVAIYARRGAEIALVLTDMMMPVMDGPATIQVLRKMNPAVRIIGASGLSANGHIAQAASLGLRHFLPKPFTAETLLKALKQVLSGEAEASVAGR